MAEPKRTSRRPKPKGKRGQSRTAEEGQQSGHRSSQGERQPPESRDTAGQSPRAKRAEGSSNSGGRPSQKKGTPKLGQIDEYIAQIRFDRSKSAYVGTVVELPDVSVESASREETQELLSAAIEDRLAELKQRGRDIPKALHTKVYPEKLELPISQGLYRQLDMLSMRERIALDRLASELLMAGIEQRAEKRKPQAHASQPSPDRHQKDRGQNHRGPNNRSQQSQQRHHRRQGGDKPRRGGLNYHETMDNRENFMDYVRKLEKGQRRK